MPVSESTIAELKDRLLRTRNADGGWGYYPRKASRLEPTCWGLLAVGDGVSADVLRRWPAVDGLLRERRDGQPNCGFHGLALTTLLARKIEHQDGNTTLLTAIQGIRGITLPQNPWFGQNNNLQAWPWTNDTFSWVEPTAYCLLALKKAALAEMRVDAQRVTAANELLFDRCSANGGWNYGNPKVLEKDLPAYVPTTALALLSLQDQTSHEAVRFSLDYLEHDWPSERSSMALSLALVALRVLGRPVEKIAAALVEQLPTTLTLGNIHAAALALYALRTDHADAAFVLH